MYANSCTWIAHQPEAKGATTTFVVIKPQNDEVSSQTGMTSLTVFASSKYLPALCALCHAPHIAISRPSDSN